MHLSISFVELSVSLQSFGRVVGQAGGEVDRQERRQECGQTLVYLAGQSQCVIAYVRLVK